MAQKQEKQEKTEKSSKGERVKEGMIARVEGKTESRLVSDDAHFWVHCPPRGGTGLILAAARYSHRIKQRDCCFVQLYNCALCNCARIFIILKFPVLTLALMSSSSECGIFF